MRIHNPKTDEYVENTSCRGCMCHDMAMIFGDDPNTCMECGCPKTLKGFEDFKKRQEEAKDA